jgi:hypothetical protein
MKKEKSIKAWAVINEKWKQYEWNNPLFQLYAGLKIEEELFPFAIFETKRDAQIFNRIGKKRHFKAVEVEIKLQ